MLKILTTRSLVHTYALRFYSRVLAGGGYLTGGKWRPEEGNKRHGCSIELTRDRLAAVAWPAVAPATARPRWRGHLGSNSYEHRRNAKQQAVVRALLCSSEGVGQLGWRQEKAEARAHRGDGNGGEKGSRLNRWASACGGVRA
jgi:hypothetical protein